MNTCQMKTNYTCVCVVGEWQDVLRWNISFVEKILISIKFILINFGNDFVHQKLNPSCVLVLLVSFMRKCKQHVLLVGGPSISSVHEFANKHSPFLIGNIRIFPADMAT